jgi:hypothetical protein
MLINYILEDHTQNQYVTFQATKKQFVFFTKEESWQFQGREYNYTPTVSDPSLYSTADTFSETNQHLANAGANTIPINSANAATDYIGSSIMTLPTIIKEQFADISYVYINDFNSLTNNILPQEQPLFIIGETNQIVTIYNGLQALRIPPNKFIDSNNNNMSYGKYMIKIVPKFIDTSVQAITNRKHQQWPINPNLAEGRRKLYKVDNNPFKGTLWNFEASPYQSGRLFGSVVEVWDPSKTVLKTTKVLMENTLDLQSSAIASLVLTPDLVGFESVNEVISIGDILRIYPRETYFDSIFINLDFVKKNNSINDVLAYLRNDAVRDLTGTGIIEIYDDDGITIDSQGAVQGNVILTYQITSDGKKEIRKRITQ